MKTVKYFFAALVLMMSSNVFAQHHVDGMMGDGEGKSPALAALLSMQPLPVAIGNFYSGNWERGIIYSTAELALFIPAANLLGRNGWGFGMHNNYKNNYNNQPSWTNQERNQFYYLLTGYIVVKLISAFDAGYSAEAMNHNLSIKYDAQYNSTMFTLNIPVR